MSAAEILSRCSSEDLAPKRLLAFARSHASRSGETLCSPHVHPGLHFARLCLPQLHPGAHFSPLVAIDKFYRVTVVSILSGNRFRP